MNKRVSNVLWGILLILGTVVLIMSQLGLMGDVRISIWKILATLLLLLIAVKSIFSRSFAGILFPIAIFCIMFDKPLGITALTPWTVLLAALLLSIGLSMIFKGWCSKGGNSGFVYHGGWKHHSDENYVNIIDEKDNETVYSTSSFSGTVKYVNTEDFKKAYIRNSFGSTKIYFDKAIIQGETAQIQVDNSFGEVELFIPKEWKIINKADISFAGVDEKNSKPSGVENKEVYLTGDVSFGAITILYI